MSGIAVDAKKIVYVTDVAATVGIAAVGAVMKVDQTGTATLFASLPGTAVGQTPVTWLTQAGLALDASGTFYLASLDDTIRTISSSGTLALWVGTSNTAGSQNGVGALATFNNPQGVAVDASGNVYVADAANNKIRLIAPGGVVTDFAGTGASGSSDGPATSATFNAPAGIAVDTAGNVYVCDTGNNEIRLITKSGTVQTVAGNGSAGFLDGTGSGARFDAPGGIALDAHGNLYVADTVNLAIRKVSSSGVVTTLAGSASRSGSTDGTGDVASFSLPVAVAVDSSGAVYVADEGNMSVRKLVYH
jgi:sugar lactone lactonase YvrE